MPEEEILPLNTIQISTSRGRAASVQIIQLHFAIFISWKRERARTYYSSFFGVCVSQLWSNKSVGCARHNIPASVNRGVF